MITISVESLARVLGTQPGAISEALKSEGDEQKPQTEIDNYLVSAFQKKIDQAVRDGRDEGFGRGKRESLSEIEKWVSENYEVAPTGDIKSQIQQLSEKLAKKPEIKPEEIEKSEVFQTKLSEAVNAVKSKFEEKENEFRTQQEQWRRQRIERILSKQAENLLKQNNFIVPEDEKIANNLKNLFVRSLMSDEYDFKLSESEDDFQITDKNGNPLKDDLHNVIGFEDIGLEKAREFFTVRSGDGRDVSGNRTQTPTGGGSAYKFEDMESAMKAYYAEKDPEKQTQIREAMKSISEDAA